MNSRITVLDFGYIELIDAWGRLEPEAKPGDEAIIAAARMSTGKGFLGWGPRCTCGHTYDRRTVHCDLLDCSGTEVPGDEKLLKYLYDNAHATPFEMCGMTIEVQAPIFVFREWHRHRTQCLAGESLINLVTPNGTTFKRTIKNLFQLKHGGVIDAAPVRHKNGLSRAGMPVTREARRKDPWRTRILPNCQTRVLRTFDEETGQYRIGIMRDVWESGIKELYEVETTAGRLRTSAQHPFLTRGGWATMDQLRQGEMIATSGRVATREGPIPPSLRQGIGVWTTMMRRRLIATDDDCYICGGTFAFNDLELDHVIPVYQDLARALDVTNLKPACKQCHREKTDREQPMRVGQCALGLKWACVLRDPDRVAEEMTYDLEMVGPDHNYVANGLVVHNSYNEMSARYTPLPDLNYIPTVERLLINSSGGNKQAGTIKDANELTEEMAQYFQRRLDNIYRDQQALYEEALRNGVPKELARVHLPVGRYSRMRASGNLRNWLGFLTLRMDSKAQWEIRQYAGALHTILREKFPRTLALHEEGRK